MASVLEPIAPGLWVIEAPLRYFGYEMGRRMAVISLTNTKGVLIHSPVELTDPLRAELDQLGGVRFVSAASSLHGHLHMEQYAATYPQAKLLACPGLQAKREDLRFDDELLDPGPNDWAGDLELKVFEGHRRLTEVEFLHPASSTLITGDLCFNIGPDWPIEMRRLAWGDEMLPRLGPTTAFRAGLVDLQAARRSVREILEWDFERILPGHGEIVHSHGRKALTEGLSWLLDDTGGPAA